jgi:hypothetical protein
MSFVNPTFGHTTVTAVVILIVGPRTSAILGHPIGSIDQVHLVRKCGDSRKPHFPRGCVIGEDLVPFPKEQHAFSVHSTRDSQARIDGASPLARDVIEAERVGTRLSI